MMSLWVSLLLGFIQGVSEFLPISSSGHLSILQNVFKLDYSETDHLLFDVLLHLGTLVAVLIAYRKEIVLMVKEVWGLCTGKKEMAVYNGHLRPGARTFLLLIVGTLPLFLVLPFYDLIGTLFFKLGFIGFALIVTGGLVYVSDKLGEGNKDERKMTIADALIIGLVQAVATLPGLSRSGTTITVGIARDIKRESAVKFSLLLSIPAVLGANLLNLISAFKAGVNWSLVPIYLAGMAMAAIVGYICLFLIKIIVNKSKFGKFSYYCCAVGLITMIVSIFI